jgi:regulator of protease activity HflC (stomatin/prohibitin superfamily)
MTTQTDSRAQPKKDKPPERKFEAGKYGLSLLVLLASYLLTVAFGVLLVSLSTYSPQQVLNFLILTTVFFTLIAGGITVFYKPAYVPTFPIKPVFVSLAVTAAGMFFLLVWIALRQPDDESQLRVVMIAMVLAALGSMAGLGAKAWLAKHPRALDSDVAALGIVVTGAVLSALLVPALLRISDPTIGMRLSILFMVFGFVLVFALMVLSAITTPDAKAAAVPDGHAGIVRVKGRITRVTFDKSIDVKLHGEHFDKVDLRLHLISLNVKDCLTADHVPTDVRANIEWKLLNTEEGVRAYYTASSTPEAAIEILATSAIVSEVGQRNSLFIAGREAQIAAGVKRLLSGAAREYGIAVKVVAITHALMKYPTPAQSMSPLTEVSRLNAMDPAVRNASKMTVKHAESLMKAEATALAGHEDRAKEEKDKVDSAGKLQSY